MNISTGTHEVQIRCPNCGLGEAILIDLAAVLKVPSDDIPSLAVRAKSKPVSHRCDQLTIRDIPVNTETGELL